MSELIALLNERQVGTVRQDRGRLTFEYAASWRDAPDAYPLSLSMPLAAARHGHASVAPFLWGLLPDSEFILSQWGRRFQVSPRNPFALLAQVGEDCAGAVQFVRPERLEAFLGAPQGAIDWLTETDVANRLRGLQSDASAWRAPHDTGQFSLAGAQPKTALVFDGQRWGVPSGREPTTHILKPATGAMDGHAQNEHLCLYRLHDIGLPEWRELAARVRTDGDALVGRVRAIAGELPDRLSDEVRKINAAGCSCAAIDRLAPALIERAKRVANQ